MSVLASVRQAIRRRVAAFVQGLVREVVADDAHRRTQDIHHAMAIQARNSSAAFARIHLQEARVANTAKELLEASVAQAKNTGLVLEFGVWKGDSIRTLASRTNQQVHGFDSFEGLPERWRDGFEAGHFKLENLPEVPANVELVKGWFSETLPGFLQLHPEPIRLLHVDCDLYSSTVTVLEACRSQLVPGTVIVFDEYFNYPGWEAGEHRAFMEFVQKYGLTFKYSGYNRFHEQVAVELL